LSQQWKNTERLHYVKIYNLQFAV